MPYAAIVVPWLHLLTLGVGLAAVWARGRALRDPFQGVDDLGAVRRASRAEAWWALALVAWLVTGARLLYDADRASTLARLTEGAFLIKLALVVGILALEAWPASMLLRWRFGNLRPNAHDAGRIEAMSYVQCVLVAAAVFASVHGAHARVFTRAVHPAVEQPGRPAAAADSALQPPEPTLATPITPTGSEAVTAEDLALLAGEVAMPLDAIDPRALRSNFAEARGGGSRQHNALDIMAPRGTPVKSAAKGRVLKLFTSAAGGLMVYAADSSERFIFQYAHLDRYAAGLRDGASLARGQVIGYVGSTGNASPSAPHLHFAIARSADVRRWSRGRPIDPLPVLVAAKEKPR